MNNSISNLFQVRIFSKLIAIVNDQNIFEKSLNQCYSRKDIRRLIELVNTRGQHYFSTTEKISFFRKLYHREMLIEFMDKKLQRTLYTMCEIHALLQKCVHDWQCDAIMLHVEKNKNFYLQIRPLHGYETLVNRRKQNLVEIQTN